MSKETQPPLPEPIVLTESNDGTPHAYTADQMRAYAAAAVAAERERCARVCRDKAAGWLKRVDEGDIRPDTARHASIAAGEIEAAIQVAAERERCAKVCEAAWHIDGQFSANEFAALVRAEPTPRQMAHE